MMVMRLCDSRLSTSTEAMLERIAVLEAAPRQAMPVSYPVKEEKVPDNAPKHTQAPPPDDVPFDFDDVPPPADAVPVFSAPELPKPLGSEKVKPVGDMPEMIAYGDILEEIKSQNEMVLFSVLENSRGYLDGDNMTVKTNSMGLFMINAQPEKKQILVECASKILGYAVKVNVVEDGDGDNKTNADFPMF